MSKPLRRQGKRETYWKFMERLLLCDVRVFSCDAKVYAMHVNPREEHDVGDDDDYYGSCCSSRVSTLAKDMSSGANSLHDFGFLFFWELR
jgi:hypothetical protein